MTFPFIFLNTLDNELLFAACGAPQDDTPPAQAAGFLPSLFIKAGLTLNAEAEADAYVETIRALPAMKEWGDGAKKEIAG